MLGLYVTGKCPACYRRGIVLFPFVKLLILVIFRSVYTPIVPVVFPKSTYPCLIFSLPAEDSWNDGLEFLNYDYVLCGVE